MPWTYASPAGPAPPNAGQCRYGDLQSEFLHRFYEKRIRPMADYTIGRILSRFGVMHSIPGRTARQRRMRVPLIEKTVKKTGGIEPSRRIDCLLGAEPAAVVWSRQRANGNDPRQTVVLWPDSFNNHLDTGPGKAAVEVLEAWATT